MIRVVQHRMGALIGETESAEVATMEAALALPWVTRWATDPRFFRFSLSWREAGTVGPRGPLPVRLMAEMDGGAVWWVVAFVYGIKLGAGDLPTWEPPGEWGRDE